jgi:DNA helicase-2/ATP-dependent DNA helicase PcrA
MERSDVIARAAAELRERARFSEETSPASITELYKTHDLVFQLCRQLKLKWIDAGSGVMLGGAYSRLQLWRGNNPDLGGAIWLHPGLPPEKRAFALAHELGHFTLHRGEQTTFHPPCTEAEVNEQADPGNLRHQNHRVEEYSPRVFRELEANAFAAELLAPRAEVRCLFATHPTCDAAWIAAHFGISLLLAQQRLMDAVLSASVRPESQRFSQPFSGLAGSQPEANDAADIIARLDPFQQVAARADGPALVIAGPGTGKTATLVGRVAHLIKEYHLPPEQILALTFSNRAAGEMRERLERSQLPGERMPVMTIHAFAATLLRSYPSRVPYGPGERKLEKDFRILDKTDAFLLMEDLLGELPLYYYRSLNAPTQHLRDLVDNFSQARDGLITPGKYLDLVDQMPLMPEPSDEPADEEEQTSSRKRKKGKPKLQRPPGTFTQEQISRAREKANAYAVWDRALRERGLVDFGGLIQRAVELLDANPDVLAEVRQRYPEILVDEFQDTNLAQAELLRRVAGESGRGLWVVGDRNQSIYRWRGASPSNLPRLKEFYPALRVYPLRRCYRSVPTIVALGSEMAARMARYSSSPDKQGDVGEPHIDHVGALEAHRQDENYPAVLRCDSFNNEVHEEAGIIEAIRRYRQQKFAFKDQAILCRTHKQAHRMAAALSAQKIPVSQVGQFFERSEVKDVLALLSLAAGPDMRGLLRARELVAGLGYPPPPNQEIAVVIHALVARHETLPGALSDTALLAGIAQLSPTTRKALALLGELAQRLRYHFSPEESHLGSTLASILLRPGGYAWQLVRVADGITHSSADEESALPLASQAHAQGALAALGELIRIVTRFDARWKREPDFRLRLSRAVTRAQKPATSKTSAQTNDPTAATHVTAPAVACFLHYLRALHLTDLHLAIPIGEADAVHILTVHASKGLEFPVVYLPMLADKQFPSRAFPHEANPPGFLEQDAQEAEQEEERCLFYVGLTRAQDVVVLTRATSYQGTAARPSDLLNLVDGALAEGQIQPLYSAEELIALEGTAASETPVQEEEDEEEERARPVNPSQMDTNVAPTQHYNYYDLDLYHECPRQYKYARRYGLLDPDQDAAARFHRYLRRGRRELREVHAEQPRTPWNEVEQRLRMRWEEEGAAGHAYDQFYWQHAQRLLRAEWKKLAASPASPSTYQINLAQDLAATLKRCIVHVSADRVAGGPTSDDTSQMTLPTVLTRVHAKSSSSKDEEDLHLPLYYLSHWQQHQQQPVRIEIAYLGDVLADVMPVPGTSQRAVRDMTKKARDDAMAYIDAARRRRSRLDKLDEAAAGIEAGVFPLRPEERRCLACPFCYVCPADPDTGPPAPSS